MCLGFEDLLPRGPIGLDDGMRMLIDGTGVAVGCDLCLQAFLTVNVNEIILVITSQLRCIAANVTA